MAANNAGTWRIMPKATKVVSFGKVDDDSSSSEDSESIAGGNSGTGSSTVCHITPYLICKVSGLPNELENGGFSKLFTLDLHLREHSLGKIAEIANLECVPNLRQLNLSYNAISKIQGLSGLRYLVELNLAENSIREIENLSELSLLERLNLSGNRIQRIPQSIAQLQSLKIFRIARNELHTIRDIKNLHPLRNLTRFVFDNNPICELPHARYFTIHHVPSLDMIDGQGISPDERAEAEARYSQDELAVLRSKLTVDSSHYPTNPAHQREQPPRSTKVRDFTAAQLVSLRQRLNLESSARANAQVELEEVSRQLQDKQMEVEVVTELAGRLRDHLDEVDEHLQLQQSPQRIRQISRERDRTDMSPLPRQQRPSSPLSARRSESRSPLNHNFPMIPDELSTDYMYSERNEAAQAFGNNYGYASSGDDNGKRSPYRSRSVSPVPVNVSSAERNRSVSNGTYVHSSAAGRQLTALQERMDRLSSRLMSSETDKQRMQREISAVLEQIQSLDDSTAAPKPHNGHNISNNNSNLSGTFVSELVARLRVRIQSLASDVQRLSEEKVALQSQLSEAAVAIEVLKSDNQVAASQRQELVRECEAHNRLVEELRETKGQLITQLATMQRFPSNQNSNQSHTDNNSSRNAAVMHLQSELEAVRTSRDDSIRTMTAMQEGFINAQKDAESWQKKFFEIEERYKSLQLSSESDLKQVRSSLSAREREVASLTASLRSVDTQRRELLAANHTLSADADIAAMTKAVSNPAIGNPSQRRGVLKSNKSPNNRKRSTKLGYLYAASTDSDDREDDSNVVSLAEVLRTHQQALHGGGGGGGGGSNDGGRANPKPLPTKANLKFNPSQLEIAAAGTMARMLVDEILLEGEPSTSGRDIGEGSVSKQTASGVQVSVLGDAFRDRLEDACVRAAMRLMHTAVANTSTQHSGDADSTTAAGVDEEKGYSPTRPLSGAVNNRSKHLTAVSPWAALGDRDVLTQMVSQAKAEMDAIQQIRLLKVEQRQLQSLVDDRQSQASALASEIAQRESRIASLEAQTVETARHASDTLNELEALSLRLRGAREAITEVEQQSSQCKRELALTQQQLSDAAALNDIEQKNVVSVRERLQDLRNECSLLESALLHSKEAVLEEEAKLKCVRQHCADQLRTLQLDVQRMQGEFRSQKEALAETEKQRTALEDDMQSRRRDLEGQLNGLMRDIASEQTRLNTLKAGARHQKTDVETLTQQRRALESDVARLSDSLLTDRLKWESEESAARMKLVDHERALSETEKKARVAKEQLAAFEGEGVLLRHSVDELRRQRGDLERTYDSRRRSAEAEASQAQQQAQVALRQVHQLSSDAEQRRTELECLQAEVRLNERKLDELKRANRELELSADAAKEELKTVQSECTRSRKEHASVVKEIETIKNQCALLKAANEADNKLCEETRRRVCVLVEEEAGLRESRDALQAAHSAARRGLEECQAMLEEARRNTDSERRNLADLRTKKSAEEREAARAVELSRFNQEQLVESGRRKAEAEASVARLHDELGRLQQKDVIAAQRRVADEARKAEALSVRAMEAQVALTRVQQELASAQSLAKEEESKLEALRSETRELAVAKKQLQENMKSLERDTQVLRGQLSVLRAQIAQTDDTLSKHADELKRLREMEVQEMRRSEKLDKAYDEAEQRLRDLRAELANTESNLEKTRSMNTEEERRVQEQRRLLRATMDELALTEKSLSASNKLLYEERQRAITEIGRLDLAKQSAQAHMFLVAEAEKRISVGSSAQQTPQHISDSRDLSASSRSRSVSPFLRSIPLTSSSTSMSEEVSVSRETQLRKAAADLAVQQLQQKQQMQMQSQNQNLYQKRGHEEQKASGGGGLSSASNSTSSAINKAGSHHVSWLQELEQHSSAASISGVFSDAPPAAIMMPASAVDNTAETESELDFRSLRMEVEKLKQQSSAVLRGDV